MLNRRNELEDMFKDVDQNQKKLVNNLLDDVVFLEKQITELKKLPFIRIHPKEQTKQETTPAAKQFKDLSQSYDLKIKILLSLLRNEDAEGESPLRMYMKQQLGGTNE